MRKVLISFITILIVTLVIIMFSGCGKPSDSKIAEENAKLKEKVKELKQDRNELEGEIEKVMRENFELKQKLEMLKETDW